MRHLIIIVFLIFTKSSFSQLKSLDSICQICDTLAKRDCGFYSYTLNPIKARKLQKELKYLKKLQNYLINTKDTSFANLKGGDYGRTYDRINDTMLLIEEVQTSYLEVKVWTVKVNNAMYKGAQIKTINTTCCLDKKGSFVFDSRIIKYFINELKVNFNFSCPHLTLNYNGDIFNENFYIKIPTKIISNKFAIFNPTSSSVPLGSLVL